MGRYQKLLRWQWAHNTTSYDFIRMFLGGALFVRGLLFMFNPDGLASIADGRELDWLVTYIPWAHLIGGAMMATGIFTRMSALIQLPILLGALLTVHIREGLMSPTQSLELSGMVTFLLLVVFAFGPGRLSLDYWFFGRETQAA